MMEFLMNDKAIHNLTEFVFTCGLGLITLTIVVGVIVFIIKEL